MSITNKIRTHTDELVDLAKFIIAVTVRALAGRFSSILAWVMVGCAVFAGALGSDDFTTKGVQQLLQAVVFLLIAICILLAKSVWHHGGIREAMLTDLAERREWRAAHGSNPSDDQQ